MKKYKNFATIIIITGFIFIIIFPIILTSSSGLIDFTDTGEIGDTIGGITSPIIGFVAAILVYFALFAQIEANEKIQTQIEAQISKDYENKVTSYLNFQLEAIRNDINDYKFSERTEKTKTLTSYEGSEAIGRFLELYKNYKNDGEEDLRKDVYQLEQLRLLLEHIELYIQSIENEKISKTDKDYLLNNIVYQYKSKIKIHLEYHKDYEEIPSAIYSIANSIETKLNLNHS